MNRYDGLECNLEYCKQKKQNTKTVFHSYLFFKNRKNKHGNREVGFGVGYPDPGLRLFCGSTS